MVHDTYNYRFHGVYKPTNITGGFPDTKWDEAPSMDPIPQAATRGTAAPCRRTPCGVWRMDSGPAPCAWEWRNVDGIDPGESQRWNSMHLWQKRVALLGPFQRSMELTLW